MSAARWILAVASALLVGTAGFAQAPKKEEPKKVEAPKEDAKPAKGQLPTYWRMLGLSEDQIQKVYKLQAKYNDEIDVLEAKVKELKGKMSKERLDILTADQKKRLEEILKEKAGSGKDK